MTAISYKRALIASGFMLLTLLGVEYFGHFTAVKPVKPLSGFPTNIGPWAGTETRFDQRIYDMV